ncbi:hypothetical protein CU098_013497, partial [Rhizopus stolonifer]
ELFIASWSIYGFTLKRVQLEPVERSTPARILARKEWVEELKKTDIHSFKRIRFRFHERNKQVSRYNYILDTTLLTHEDYSSHVYTQLESFNISIPKSDSTNAQKYSYIRQDTPQLVVKHHQITRKLKAYGP